MVALNGEGLKNSKFFRIMRGAEGGLPDARVRGWADLPLLSSARGACGDLGGLAFSGEEHEGTEAQTLQNMTKS